MHMNNVPFPLQAQQQTIQALFTGVGGWLIELFESGHVAWFTLSIERAKSKAYHLQGVIMRKVLGLTWTLQELIGASQKQLKAIVTATVQTGLRVVNQVKPCQKNETDKAGGYCHKDEGLSHYQNINRGRTREDFDRMKNTYRTDAGGSSFTSQKIHTQTHEKEKKMDINPPGNLLSLECWFLHAQGLRELIGYVSVVGWVSMALSTNLYSLSFQFVSGTKGAPLDERRTNALRMANQFPSAVDLNVGRIRRALFDSDDATLNMPNHPDPAVPPPEMLEAMSLEQARRVCQRVENDREGRLLAATCEAGHHDSQPRVRTWSSSDGHRAVDHIAPQMAEKKKRSGKFLIADMLTSPQALDTGIQMEDAGLRPAALLSTDQGLDRCGYTSVGMALMCRALCLEFQELDMATAATTNPVSAWVRVYPSAYV